MLNPQKFRIAGKTMTLSAALFFLSGRIGKLENTVKEQAEEIAELKQAGECEDCSPEPSSYGCDKCHVCWEEHRSCDFCGVVCLPVDHTNDWCDECEKMFKQREDKLKEKEEDEIS